MSSKKKTADDLLPETDPFLALSLARNKLAMLYLRLCVGHEVRAHVASLEGHPFDHLELMFKRAPLPSPGSYENTTAGSRPHSPTASTAGSWPPRIVPGPQTRALVLAADHLKTPRKMCPTLSHSDPMSS